jgi:hypothetical protein
MQKRTLAAPGWAAESNGLTLDSLEVDALQNCNGPFVIALPHILCAKNNAPTDA